MGVLPAWLGIMGIALLRHLEGIKEEKAVLHFASNGMLVIVYTYPFHFYITSLH